MTTSPTRIEAGRRPDIEKELSDSYHVKWVFHPAMPTADFDMDKSLHNQARFEAVDQATVDSYAEGVRRGDDFPAVIAYRPAPKARLIIIDGNHRLGAHFKAGKPIAVYEIDRNTDRRAIALMTFAFNTKHGRPTSENERIMQAKYLVDNGSSIEAAAAAVSLQRNVLKKALEKSKADARADEVGVKRSEWDSLHATVRNRLSAIFTDEGFADATKLAFQARLGAEEVFDLVGLLNATRSGARQRALVAQQRDVYQERIQQSASGVLNTNERRGQTPKMRLALSLGQVLALPESDEAIVSMYAQGERKDAAKRVREAAARLTAVADALSR